MVAGNFPFKSFFLVVAALKGSFGFARPLHPLWIQKLRLIWANIQVWGRLQLRSWLKSALVSLNLDLSPLPFVNHPYFGLRGSWWNISTNWFIDALSNSTTLGDKECMPWMPSSGMILTENQGWMGQLSITIKKWTLRETKAYVVVDFSRQVLQDQ